MSKLGFNQIVFLIILAITVLNAMAEENYTLQFVQMIYRHGDRAPKRLYPTDPNPADIWTLGLGSLTENGRRQHYHLGRLFRKMYEDFITTKPTEVQAFSDINVRCLVSAESNFASFFAPKPKWQFEENLNWQPIPIISVPFILDEYIGKAEKCPAFKRALMKQLNTSSNVEFNEKNQDLYDYLTKHTGANIRNYIDVKEIYNTLYIEDSYNFIIPDWCRRVWDRIVHLYNNVFPLVYSSKEIQRLRAGPFLGVANKKFDDKINGNLPEQKLQTYSAHDDNIAVILAALDNLSNEMIPYCSTLIFELHSGPNGDYFIRLRFLNTDNFDKYDQEAKTLMLPGCQEFCPYSRYLEITEPFAHLNYEHDCEI